MIYATIGCAASGKSTWAEKFAATNGFNYNSSDKIRGELYGDETIQGNPQDVFSEFYKRVENSILQKRPIVCDATNVKDFSRQPLIDIAKKHKVNLEWHYFPVTLAEAQRRNKNRERFVPEEVVAKQWRDLRLPTHCSYRIHSNFIPEHHPLEERKFVVSDLDGTLSIMCDRSPFDASRADEDTPNYPVVRTLKLFIDAGYIPIFVSAREDKDAEPTKRFLAKHLGVDTELNKNLFMRETGDNRQDAVVKVEIFLEKMLPKGIVGKVTFDDRVGVVRAWRSLQLHCFQVAEGDF